MRHGRLVIATLTLAVVAAACGAAGFEATASTESGTSTTLGSDHANDTTTGGTAPPSTTSPTTASTTVASTVPTTTTTTATTTTATVPVPLGEAIADRVSTTWQGDDLVLSHADGSSGSFVGPLYCLAREAGRCVWHLTFASATPSSGVVDGFTGRALLLRLVGGTQIHAIVAALPLDVTARSGIPVLAGATDDEWHLLTLAYGPTRPTATEAWNVSVDPPGFTAVEPMGLAASRGTGRLVSGDMIDVTTDSLDEIPLWHYSGAIVGDMDLLRYAVSVFRDGEDAPPAVVWLRRKLGSIPDGSPLWWTLDTAPLPVGTAAVSIPGECSAGGAVVVVALIRETCDVCIPAADGWIVDLAAEALVPVPAGAITCSCICEG